MDDVLRNPRRGDGGFTLVELLVVTVMMGLIATVVAAAVTVVLRTSPAADDRTSDARSLQGLVTWLPQDIDAAPPGGFDTSVTAWPCAGPAPSSATSFAVLTVKWQERMDVTRNFGASYRYELVGSEWHMARYSCDDQSTAPAMGAGRRVNLTSALPPWSNLAPPAKVTMCSARVDNGGNCPAGNVIGAATSPNVQSLKIKVTRLDGVVATIDAAPKNPDQDLADDPNASTNAAPILANGSYTVNMAAGATVTIDLNTTHGPSDANGDALSVAIDSSEPVPPGITASTADPLNVTLTAAAGLPTGLIGTPLTLIVSDYRAGWVAALIRVNIITAVNNPPQVSPATYNLQIAQGQSVVVPLNVTHGAFDPNGDPMTVTAPNWPASVVFQPTVGAPLGPLEVRINAMPGAPLGAAPTPVDLVISDNRGGSIAATITIEIIAAPPPNGAPTVTSSNVGVSMLAGGSVTLSLNVSHGASDPDGDSIAASLNTSTSQPVGITTTFNGALGVTITANPGLAAGPVALPVSLLIKDTKGAQVAATVTVTINPTPPPPSDCVLGSLSATPNPVDRQGNGNPPQLLKQDVTVTITYAGSCDGLVLRYDTGDTSGLGVGTGRVFPPGSPSKIVIYGKGNGGTEKWVAGAHTLTASTTSAVTPNTRTTNLTVS